MKMVHIATIEKSEITFGKFNRAQLVLAIAAEKLGDYGIATDYSEHYEFWLMGDDKRDAEKLKYFLLGFLNMPHLI